MSEQDGISFEDALKRLELDEEDLRRLIATGEILVFRVGTDRWLRREDVDRVSGVLDPKPGEHSQSGD